MASCMTSPQGAPAGFLSRVTSLEREISFLKQKVEDDARWKFIVQQFVLDNFAFDIQGTLINSNRDQYHHQVSRTRETVPNASTSSHNTSNSASHSKKYRTSDSSNKSKSPKYKKTIKLERRKTRHSKVVFRTAEHRSPIEEELSAQGFIGDDNDEQSEQEHCFGNDNICPKDLIITPDICGDTINISHHSSSSTQNERIKTSGGEEDSEDESLEEYDPATLSGIEVNAGGEMSDHESSSSSSTEMLPQRRQHRKMEWTLIGTYPNLATMKQQFNLREWSLSTRQINERGAKIYYYCKECRKNGPGRLYIRYATEDSEVEVLKNQLEHDHTNKRRLTEEMKIEIFNLYKAGLTESPKIAAAFKISKPHMRQPSVKQICRILQPLRMKERNEKFKEKIRTEKEKVKAGKPKKPKKEKLQDETVLGLSSSIIPSSYSGSSSSVMTQQHMNQFNLSGSEAQGSNNFQRPQIISVTSFPIAGSSAQQQFYQTSMTSYDSSVPNQSSVHLTQHSYQ